jgi:ParB/RepB/Spo0J family partition protein
MAFTISDAFGQPLSWQRLTSLNRQGRQPMKGNVHENPEVILVAHERLVQDPENPRRFYPEEDVRRMAQSIRQSGGVDQALIVTPLGASGKYRVIDGNFRLAAARFLGEAAPLLKCEVRREVSRREKLLIMARTSTLWFAKDPISEARHYRRLIEEEAMSQAELARELGCSLSKITSRLKLLELDAEVQDLVAEGKLPKMPEVVEALAGVRDRRVRVELARELGRRKASVRSVVKACEKVACELERREIEARAGSRRMKGEPPSLAVAAAVIERALPEDDRGTSLAQIRQAARQACDACDIKADLLTHVAEPAWAVIKRAAGETCDLCSLKDVRRACHGCPLPEFLIRMTRMADRLQEVDAHGPLASS